MAAHGFFYYSVGRPLAAPKSQPANAGSAPGSR
jgi:hypothetical protein